MTKKVVINKSLLDNIGTSKEESNKKSEQPAFDNLINLPGILAKGLDEIMKVNSIDGIRNKISHLKKERGKVQQFIINNKFIFKPAKMISAEKYKEISEIYQYLEKYIDQRIEIFEREIGGATPEVYLNDQGTNKIISLDDLKSIINENVSNAVLKSQQSNDDDTLLTRKEVAKLFSVSLVTISEWMKSGELPYLRMKRRVYFKKGVVMATLQSKQKYKRKK